MAKEVVRSKQLGDKKVGSGDAQGYANKVESSKGAHPFSSSYFLVAYCAISLRDMVKRTKG